MKILFLKTSIGSSLLPSFDMGVGSMAAVLKKNGHKVNFFSYDSLEASKALYARIQLFKPEIVGISVTASTFGSAVEVAKYIKSFAPEILIVIGGVHTTIYPECINASKAIDAICIGEGENSFLDFVNNVAKKDDSYIKTRGYWVRDRDNKIVKNPVALKLVDINKLPFPDRDIFLQEGVLKFPREYDHTRFCLEFIFSRGCPFDCTYCSNHALNAFHTRAFVRQKDPKLAIKEIKAVMKKYRYDYFRFHDDTFTLNRKWLNAFLDLYQEIKVPFHCNIRADVCSLETLTKMRDAGCEKILIGVESGDDELRTNVLGKNISNKVFFQAYNWARQLGIQASAYILVGLPGETPEKFMNTIDFASDMDCDEMFLYVFYPYPGTGLYTQCLEKGYLLSNYSHQNVRERADTVLTMPDFPREDILFYYENFHHFVRLAKETKCKRSRLGMLYVKTVFYLSTKPPSYKFFHLFQILLKFVYLFRSVANSLISLVRKVS